MSEMVTKIKFAISSPVYIEDFTDTKPVGRRTDNIITKRKRTKGQTMIYKIIHRKLKIEQHETHYKPLVNTGAPE